MMLLANVMWLSQCHLVLPQSYYFTVLMLLSTVIYCFATVMLLCHLSCFLTTHADVLPLSYCFARQAAFQYHTTSLYHAGCRCHPTVRLSYFLATLKLLPAVILLCQPCCMPACCVLLCHYHASCQCHTTVLLSSDLQSSLILLCLSHASFLWSYCFATIMLLLPLSGCHATHAAALPMPYRFAGRTAGQSHSTLPQSCRPPLSCYLATIELLRDCQGTLPLSCSSVTVILLRLLQYPSDTRHKAFHTRARLHEKTNASAVVVKHVHATNNTRLLLV